MAGKHYSNKVKIILQLSDLFFLNLAFIIVSVIRTNSLSFLPKAQLVPFLILINIFWIVISENSDLYDIGRDIKVDKKIYKVALIISIHCLIITLIISSSAYLKLGRHHLTYFYVVAFYLISIGKILNLYALKYLRKLGFNSRNVVIIGGGVVGNEVRTNLMTNYSFGFKYLGIYDDNPADCLNRSEVLGTIDDFKNFSIQNNIDEAFIALPDSAYARITELMQFCDSRAIRVKIVPDFSRYIRSKIKIDFYGSIPMILLREEPLESLRNRFIKRSIDILFSLFVIVFVLSWVIPIMGFLIKLHSKGPVFFMQRRTGLNNKEFNIIKFRTMRVNNLANKVQARKGDARITTIGQFLRKTNIDELPQFFNILMGNMSIVGPRPHMIEHTRQYSEVIETYLVRHFTKPGLTGWAQVNGYRGDTTQQIQMENRVKHDVYYLENWSVWLDIEIFFMTIFNIFKGEPNAV
jgi:putative colanic acid biosynthesis UDP-glucose lipid carrier transferase